MRFSSIVLSGALAVLASAQSSPTDKSSSAPSGTVALTPAQSSVTACIDACKAGDVECQSHCISVPSPNEDQVNATTDCVAECDQGDGSQKETDLYAACVDKCISGNYFSSGGTPKATGAPNKNTDSSSAEATVTETASTATGVTTATKTSGSKTSGTSESDSEETATDSESESETGTASSSAASSTNSDSAAPAVAVGGVSMLGLIAAVLAL